MSSNEYSSGDVSSPEQAEEVEENADDVTAERERLEAERREEFAGLYDAFEKFGGGDFEPYFADDYSILRREMAKRERSNTAPDPINPWQVRIGLSTFMVPPVNMKVSRASKLTSMGGGLRTASSPKFNTGHTETALSLTILFPTHQSIWGIDGEVSVSGKEADTIIDFDTDDDHIIDKYMSSLRGLITQFKYAPFLPIKNSRINGAFGINAVALQSMSVSTVEGYPFCLAVQLNMLKFNHEVYLPMVADFDHAIHWGRYRQYMGRAAKRLTDIAGQGWLTKGDIFDEEENDGEEADEVTRASLLERARESAREYNIATSGIGTFNTRKEWNNGSQFELYYPKNTPSRVAYPDLTFFRDTTPRGVEKSANWWQQALTAIGYNYATEREGSYDRVSKYSGAPFETDYMKDEQKVLDAFIRDSGFKISDMRPSLMDTYIEQRMIIFDDMYPNASDHTRSENISQLRALWFGTIFKTIMVNPRADEAIEFQDWINNAGLIKEWEVPMAKLGLENVAGGPVNMLVKSVAVNLGNMLTRVHLQMEESPSYQHIGSHDTTASISLIVFGEESLTRINRVIDHVNGLARLERGHSVLGFLGVKNAITALCGMKYCMIQSVDTESIEGYPDVYQVNLTLVDFDVFQQKREMLDSSQQQELMEAFSKRNPFLRIKQHWAAFNAYPDMPLAVRNDEGKVIGNLDPDFYFRSFNSIDSDIAHFEEMDPVTHVTLGQVPEGIDDGIETDDGGHVGGGGTEPTDEGPIEHGEYSPAGISISKDGITAFGEAGPDSDDTSMFSEPKVFWEPNAESMASGMAGVPGHAPAKQHLNTYVDNAPNARGQYEAMMKDTRYRDITGSMVRAFPTYMLWLIDEGGNFAGVKLFDNFYGLQSVLDISVLDSEDSMDNTMVIKLSNIYSRLSTEYRDILDEGVYDMAKVFNTQVNTSRNLESGLREYLVQLDTINLKPGVRVHLRLGYSSNPNNLHTVFNGMITEVETGDVVTITCQSDTAELSRIVNGSDRNADSGKIDGSLFGSFYFSEPRDLMTRLLSMGESTVKETLSRATRGVVFSENKYGIRHFGTILTDPMTKKEERLSRLRQELVGLASRRSADPAGSAMSGGDASNDHVDDDDGEPMDGDSGGDDNSFDEVDAEAEEEAEVAEMGEDYDAIGADINAGAASDDWQGMLGLGSQYAGANVFSLEIVDIFTSALANISSKRSYELFRRNIYPGNGTGLGQFVGGDFGDGGLATAAMPTGLSADNDPALRAEQMEEMFGPDGIAAGLDDIEPDTGAPTVAEEHGGLFSSTALFNPVAAWNMAGVAMGGMGSLIHPMGRILGLTSEIADDDVDGFDEVSFKASTYMKSVWDLFMVCAALLPNYIVAVRPFEDRSTVFYGKPHWNWTSAVIPISTGLKAVPLSAPDDDMVALMRRTVDQIKADEADGLDFFERVRQAGYAGLPMNMDPNEGYTADIPGSEDWYPAPVEGEDYFDILGEEYTWPVNGGSRALLAFSDEGHLPLWARHKMHNAYMQNKDIWKQYRDRGAAYLSAYALEYGWKDPLVPANYTDEHYTDSMGQAAYEVYGPAQGEDEEKARTHDDANSIWFEFKMEFKKEGNNIKIYNEILNEKDDSGTTYRQKVRDNNDIDLSPPIVQIFPQWVTPPTLKEYKAWRALVDAGESGGDEEWMLWVKASAWMDDRAGLERIIEESSRQHTDKSRAKEVEIETYDELMDIFIESLWKNAYMRGWVARTANTEAGGIWDRVRNSQIVSPVMDLAERGRDAIGVPDNIGIGIKYSRHYVDTLESFRELLWKGEGDIVYDSRGKRSWDFTRTKDRWRDWASWVIKNSAAQGGTTQAIINGANSMIVEKMAEDYRRGLNSVGVGRTWDNWFETNIRGILDALSGAISSLGTIVSGVVNLIRLGMMIMNGGLEAGSFNQRQSNALNKIFNDSIYYNAGPPGSLAYFVDNPFTREYHEPVIEVREPFQRIHFLSSYKNIITNNIREFSGVPTVVTATSNGGHPVTVHFDKGAPTDKQVETSVETGLAWQSPDGPPLLKYILHPMETLASFATHFNNGDQETSAKRVGLWFLKEGLKDIYGGEITIIGDPSIRAHDILYIGDVQERIFGLCQVEQVVHHFNSELGFVTSVTPNAIVTINDPANYTWVEYIRSRFSSWQLREQVKSNYKRLKEKGYSVPEELTMTELIKSTESSVTGSVSFTGGNTAIVKDLAGADATGMLVDGGVLSKAFITPEENYERLESAGFNPDWESLGWDGSGAVDFDEIEGTDSSFGDNLLSSISPGMAALGVGLLNPLGAPIALAGYAGWKIFDWVNNDLMDQQGCYIQYLTKDGRAMDGGLAYANGVAVGQQRSSTLFANSLRISLPRQDENGNSVISTDDLLSELGWEEREVDHLRSDLSLYTNELRARIMEQAGRPEDSTIDTQEHETIWMTIAQEEEGALPTNSGILTGSKITGEGGTFNLSHIFAPPMPADMDGNLAQAALENPNDPGVISALWLREYLLETSGEYGMSFAVRVLRRDEDAPGLESGTSVMIFADPGTAGLSASDRKKTLLRYASSPLIGWDSYLQTGRPYTANWASAAAGKSRVKTRDLNLRS